MLQNIEIANRFDELADLLEIEGANPFRVRAYRTAAQTVRGLTRSLADMRKAGTDFDDLPGIGKDLAAKIETLLDTGELPTLTAARKRTSPELPALLNLEGLGPKRVKQLYLELGVRTLDDLRHALEAKTIRDLEGFGAKTEEKIRASLERTAGETHRTRLDEAEKTARSLVRYLRTITGVKRVAVAGSYRRRRETVGDLDILVTASKRSPVMERFVNFRQVEEVLSRGETRSTIRLRSGMTVDLRDVRDECYGAALHYFTGSKAHNIAIRTLGVKRSLKINEYGVFRKDKLVAGRNEKDIYASVGLPYIEPELRENRGEIDAARKGALPALVRLADMRGDLHVHTTASDGRDTVEKLAIAARELGHACIAVTDRFETGNLRRLQEQAEEIDALNERLDGITILKGAEVDIREDGELSLPDYALSALDLTVCAIHSGFALSRKKQTQRILRAMDNVHFNIFAHPTGRRVGVDEGHDLDMEAILKAAAERGCILEINSQPDRLDLPDIHCRMAKDIGVKLAINSGARSKEELDRLRFGVDQARRGWLEKQDVINSLPLKKLRTLLSR